MTKKFARKLAALIVVALAVLLVALALPCGNCQTSPVANSGMILNNAQDKKKQGDNGLEYPPKIIEDYQLGTGPPFAIDCDDSYCQKNVIHTCCSTPASATTMTLTIHPALSGMTLAPGPPN
ncbi:MAG: hypothetical protein MCSN_2100 [Candidatus Microsyncoccus archaeolyticus]|nr:MAG: hypothetical protein MCSN_2100 [Candidatus Parcubacteria bacterium]